MDGTRPVTATETRPDPPRPVPETGTRLCSPAIAQAPSHRGAGPEPHGVSTSIHPSEVDTFPHRRDTDYPFGPTKRRNECGTAPESRHLAWLRCLRWGRLSGGFGFQTRLILDVSRYDDLFAGKSKASSGRRRGASLPVSDGSLRESVRRRFPVPTNIHQSPAGLARERSLGTLVQSASSTT